MPRQSRQSLQRTADRQLAEAARGSDRYVDLQLDWIDYRGHRIARFGGVWDRTAKEYVGDARSSRVVRMHDGQVDAARFFDEWLAIHLGVMPPNGPMTFQLLLAGGRRGGKTTFGVDAVAAYNVAVPEALTWCVTPSDAYYDEPLGYLEALLPRHWYTELGAPHWTHYLINGSEIVMRSGHTPRKLKKGRADLVFMNEAQQFQEAAHATVSASIVDVGGLVIAAANPPDVGDPGTWVAELASKAQRKIAKHARYFFFNPEKNPEIKHEALHALKETMSDHEYRIQVLGEFLLPPDAVLYAWDNGPNGNEMPYPELGKDLTEAFTKKHEGRGYRDILAVDIQNYPWHALTRWRVIENPQFPDDLDQAYLWCVGEVFLEKGDEGLLAEEAKLLDDGIGRLDPDRTLVVMDASGEWQQATRDITKQKAEYRGRGSMDIFREHGFLDVVPPDRYMKKNPEVADRCRNANARICTASGRRLVFVDPERCPKTVASIRSWRSKNGQPSRRSEHAHGGDAFTYLIWRFFPRRKKGGKVDIGSPSNTPTTSTGGRRRFRGGGF